MQIQNSPCLSLPLHLGTLALMLLACVPQAANASSCSKPMLHHYGVEQTDECECGTALKNITASLPPSLKLVGACYLNWRNPGAGDGNGGKPKFTFDRYVDGSIPEGELLLSGKLSLHGTLEVAEGPAGRYWFHPKPRLIARETPLSSQLRTITFSYDEKQFNILRPPKRLYDKDCYLVDVSMDIADIHVVIADGDSNGATPVRFTLKKAGNYRACPNF